MNGADESSTMGILEKILSIGSPRTRLLRSLAEIAGKKDAVVERIRRHASQCNVPRLSEELARIADEEDAHARVLRNILGASHLWPKREEMPAHEGSNNWERVSNDLQLLSDVTLALSRQRLHWETADPAIAEQLGLLASEDSRILPRLREVAAKLDPQAID